MGVDFVRVDLVGGHQYINICTNVQYRDMDTSFINRYLDIWMICLSTMLVSFPGT